MSSVPFNADPDSGLSKNHEPYKRSHNTTKTWTIGTFSTGIISAIVGGALLGAYFRKAWNNCESAREALGDDNFDNVSEEDCMGPGQLFWAGAFFIVVSCVLGVCFIVFLILHCTRRGRRNNPGVMYHSAPVIDQNYAQPYDPYAARLAGPPPAYPVSVAQYDAQSGAQSNFPMVQVNTPSPSPSPSSVPEPEPAHYDPKLQHPPKENAPDRFA
jgi:hypothetical protein